MMSKFSNLNKIKNHPLVKKRPWLVQFFKYSIVGASGTMIDYGILNLLVLVFGISIYISATVSFSAGVINNFLLNRFWTFRNIYHGRGVPYQFFQFLIVSSVGLGLTLLIMHILIQYFHIWYNIAKAVAIVIVLFWNFTANKFWTFKANISQE